MWLTIDEAARYLKISKETLYKMAQKEQIPASKLRSQWRFNQPLIDEWLQSQSSYQFEKNVNVTSIKRMEVRRG